MRIPIRLSAVFSSGWVSSAVSIRHIHLVANRTTSYSIARIELSAWLDRKSSYFNDVSSELR